jgi:WD40 repeat protein
MSEQSLPDELPRWATEGGALVTEPTESKKNTGWVAEMPSANAWNWLHLKAYEWLNYLQSRLLLTPGLQAYTALTLSGSSITPTRGNHTVDTPGGSANLQTIVTTNFDDGRILILAGEDDANPVLVIHEGGGAGQIHLIEEANFTLTEKTYLTLQRRGADWYEIANSQVQAQLRIWDYQNVALRKNQARAAYSTMEWMAVAGFASTFVAVGTASGGGQTTEGMISGDGQVWATVSMPNGRWRGIAYAAELGLFVAVGDGDNQVAVSAGGSAFSAETAPATNTWESVCWSPELGRFVAVSSDGSARVMYSDDGSTWIGASAAAANAWKSVCWSPELGIFVAVSADGASRVMWSENGVTWTSATPGTAKAWQSVAWSPEHRIFLAVGTDGRMSSTDGLTWTVASVTGDWSCVAWANKLKCFLVTASGGTYRVAYSRFGGPLVRSLAAEANQWQGVCWSDDLFMGVAVANSGTNKVLNI